MTTKTRRDRKNTCVYCRCRFTPDKYTYATQKSCKSGACERAANAERQQRHRDRRKKDPPAYRSHLESEAVRAKNNRLRKRLPEEGCPGVARMSHSELMAVVVGQITLLTGSGDPGECGEVIRSCRRKGRQLLRSEGG